MKARKKAAPKARKSLAPRGGAQAKQPVTRIKEAAKRAGIDQIPRLNAPDLPDEHGETRAARSARREAEHRALTCEVPGSLGARVRRLLGVGLWVDPDAPDSDNCRSMSGSLDHAMSRGAAIQLRALALALDGGGARGESGLDPDLYISNEDAALALAGIATMLEVGFELADDLRFAQDQVVAS